MTKISTINPVGYIIAPLAAPLAHLIVVPFWFAVKFGFDGTFITGLFWQLVFFLLLMSFSLGISMPVLWAFRNVAHQFLLPKSWFVASVIVLAFLFSWLLLNYLSAVSVTSFIATVVCGLVLNMLIFARFFTTT